MNTIAVQENAQTTSAQSPEEIAKAKAKYIESRANDACSNLLRARTYEDIFTGKDVTEKTAVRLLADMMHLSDQYSFKVSELVEDAKRIYEHELEHGKPPEVN